MASDAVSSTPTAVSSTPTPTPALRRRWDVFLSFRGEDTRRNFTDRLYTRLQQKGVRAFRDNEGLNRGDRIDRCLLDAIEDSAAFIAIISPNYASSHWCLEELAKVCECNRLILPVFHMVDPSHVRRQRGPFHQHFKDLEARFGEDEVSKWRKAMEKAGGIAGSVVNGPGDEADVIQTLVNSVLAELSKWSGVASFTVGLDSRVEEVLTLLDLKSNSIRVLGIHGPGGVGKSTLAKALYNKLVTHFETRSFISNVKKILAQENGLLSLQIKLIGDLSGMASHVNDVNAGIVAIKSIVQEKRVLIVLDDVDDASQLMTVAGRKKWRKWFYEGSRIIITTRDREVLHELHENELYEVKQLNSSESLQLFSHHALGRVTPTPDFLPLSQQIVSLTGGLPLALEVFGSLLYDKRNLEEWEDALQKLKQMRPRDLQGVLKISYDDLDEQEKCIFLDIACLFIKMGMKKEDAIDILKGCGFRAEIGIKVLIDKSLLKIAENYTLWMHDQLRDMGRQIVLHENNEDLGMRSRLWDRSDILRVLQNNMGSRSIQGMVLDFKSDIFMKDLAAAWSRFRGMPNFTTAVAWLKEIHTEYFQHAAEKERELILQTKSFEPMINLRLLQIDNVRLDGKFKLMPAELKWLQWRGCTLKTLPYDFCPQGLRVLDLSESKNIEQLWGRRWWSWYNNRAGENLMIMNLRGCYNLTAIPDLSGNQALEKLILERCYGLVKIHKSIGDLISLLHLDLSQCKNLVEFPSDVSGLKNLETLNLSGCSKLKELPENISYMKSLRELLLDGTVIEKLPESIFRLTRLERLSLNDCQSLKRLPTCIGKLKSLRELSFNDSALEKIHDSIGSLTNLERLSLMRCQSLDAIPDSVGSLKLLTEFLMNGSPVNELPTSIGSLSNLKDLSVGYCRLLSKLPASIEGLASMVALRLDGTSIMDLPDQIGGLKTLRRLEMRFCKCLKSLPEAIGSMGSLNTLIIVNAPITELPESIGMLENLIMLNLNKCKRLQRLPDSIGNLKSLHQLKMEETAVRQLPESFGLLSNLMRLLMAKRPHLELPQTLGPTETKVLIAEEKPELVVLPTSFSNLSLLYELDARAWKISGKIPDDFDKLSSLEVLNLGCNNFSSLPSSLRGLSILRKLLLPHCEELKALPPLPSSLIELNVENCYALEFISDLSNLESLQELNLTNCKKLVDIPGVERLKSLKGLFMSGCSSCASMVKRGLSKVALKNLRTLSIPGSEIPGWFSRNVAIFSKRKNLVIKSVIIGVVVSLNHHIQDELRDQLPSVPGIEANILRMNRHVFGTMLPLTGVPKTDEDHLYLCRYRDFHPIVSMLKDDDKIQVTMRNPPTVKGLELKKSGIYLIFENDDDYDEDEASLGENLQTVSEKIARFFASSEEGNSISDSIDEVEREMQETGMKEEWKEEKKVCDGNHRSSSILSFIVALSSCFLLSCWLWRRG